MAVDERRLQTTSETLKGKLQTWLQCAICSTPLDPKVQIFSVAAPCAHLYHGSCLKTIEQDPGNFTVLAEDYTSDVSDVSYWSRCFAPGCEYKNMEFPTRLLRNFALEKLARDFLGMNGDDTVSEDANPPRHSGKHGLDDAGQTTHRQNKRPRLAGKPLVSPNKASPSSLVPEIDLEIASSVPDSDPEEEDEALRAMVSASQALKTAEFEEASNTSHDEDIEGAKRNGGTDSQQEKERREAWLRRKVDEYGAPPHSQYIPSIFAA